MSALGGIYNFNDKPVDERALMSLGIALENHGPDGGDAVTSGAVGLVYRAFHTNRESRFERQPLISAHRHLLCWDGRLDNRAELISLLAIELNHNQSDAGIVMAAYLKWGTECLVRFLGDFALSLWDPDSRTLLLARDAAGPRPLYYHKNHDRIVWSSELRSLLDLADIHVEINDEYVAGFLARGAPVEVTPYKNIYAVAPGHAVIISDGRLQMRRFWQLSRTATIRYQTDAEYEEHFRSLFRDAVRCRLRVEGPAWATLSGGLDSSAIVCMADDILATENVQTSRIETVSYVYDESTTCDERNFIECVEERRGAAGHHLRDEDYPALGSFPDESEISFPNFLDCFVNRHRALCSAMKVDGARVLITGHGGDEIVCSGANPTPQLGDHLVQHRPRELHRALIAWGKALKRPYLDLLWHDGLLPLLPPQLQLMCGVKPHFKLPPWYDKDFAARMNMHERYLLTGKELDFDLPSARDQAIGFQAAMQMVAKGSYQDRGAIEVSHPFLHRPLVEFLQAIPFEQRVRPGETRSLMRRALRDLLPEKVLKRKSKKGPQEALFRAITRQWPRLRTMFDDPLVCARGYMDAAALRTALERVRHGCEKNAFPILLTICLEFWLRAVENRRSSARNNAALNGPITRLSGGESCSHESGPLTPCPTGHSIPSAQAHA
jgi:asparagine synthase (glutamine-hydrolysing)